MKNTMFAENINEKVEAVKSAMTEVILGVEPDLKKTADSTQLERVHSLYFLKAIDNLREAVVTLEALLDLPEEEFEKLATDEGKRTLDETEFKLMMSMMMDMAEHKMRKAEAETEEA